MRDMMVLVVLRRGGWQIGRAFRVDDKIVSRWRRRCRRRIARIPVVAMVTFMLVSGRAVSMYSSVLFVGVVWFAVSW